MTALSRAFSHPMVRLFAGLCGLGLCALGVTRLAFDQRLPPGRCPPGMVSLGPRCCGDGQALTAGRCQGRALSCSSLQDLDADGQCVARFGVVSLAGGELAIGAADWEGASEGERFPRVRVAPFRLDSTEVTLERWRACGSCSARSGEPGLPVTDVSAAEADAFCRSQRGRLPTAAEWVFAAAGSSARRYAWGSSGLVCRRAAFGLAHGPCAESGQAELAGSRPDGASPDGVQDLTGNVAEWTLESDGSFAARGGSYLSTSAAELKTWAVVPSGSKKALHIGLRCAYPP